MKIATWNVNSINVRKPHLLTWLTSAKPDVVLLQELKTVDEKFPASEVEDLGYNVAVHGQKTYNGVAILSKTPLEDVQRGLPGNTDDDQSRYIEAFTGGVRVASIYLPNGNPAPGEKFDYKLRWMGHLVSHAHDLLQHEEVLVLAGDYNVCPTDEDVYDPKGWRDDALCRPESRSKFRELVNLGFTDAIRVYRSGHAYSFWDYQGGAWQKDNGLRIDHLMLSPQAADLLREAGIDREERGKEKPSDHVPVWCVLDVKG